MTRRIRPTVVKSRRKWFLIEDYRKRVMFDVRHRIESPEVKSTACGIALRPNFSFFTQHWPKKEPPRCRSCVRANAHENQKEKKSA